MSWMSLSLCSAIVLGFYEIAKKAAVRENAVPAVLFFNVLTSALLWTPMLVVSHFATHRVPFDWLIVDQLSWFQHGLLFAKSLIAGSSWIFASFALKHLPMSIAAPIRASSPFEWRWSIPMIAVLLLLSDFMYFTAIEKPDALISVISPLRRTSVVIAFIAGIRIYGEQNWRPKAACIATLLAGVYIISLN